MIFDEWFGVFFPPKTKKLSVGADPDPFPFFSPPLLNAAAEIEQVSSLFQEKQAELQAAVLRVEQLSLQLEDLRRGKLNGIQASLGGQVTGAAALELRKLYQELQVMQS